MNRTIDNLIATRSDIYGEPSKNLACIRELSRVFSSYYDINPSETLLTGQVMQSIFVKIGRIATGRPHEDNWNDLMGYSSLGKMFDFGIEEPDKPVFPNDTKTSDLGQLDKEDKEEKPGIAE